MVPHGINFNTSIPNITNIELKKTLLLLSNAPITAVIAAMIIMVIILMVPSPGLEPGSLRGRF
jgi:hypothetical protein